MILLRKIYIKFTFLYGKHIYNESNEWTSLTFVLFWFSFIIYIVIISITKKNTARLFYARDVFFFLLRSLSDRWLNYRSRLPTCVLHLFYARTIEYLIFIYCNMLSGMQWWVYKVKLYGNAISLWTKIDMIIRYTVNILILMISTRVSTYI